MRYIVIRKMTLNTLLMMLSLFFVTSYAFFEHTSISIPSYSGLKLPLLIMGALFLIPLMGIYVPRLNQKRYLSVVAALLLLIVILGVVMVLTRDSAYSDSVVRGTIRLVLYLVELFLLMVTAAELGEGQRVLRFIFRYLLVILVINDLLMFTGLAKFKVGRHETYLVGSKFSSSYLHMNFLAMWAIHNSKKLRRYRISLWKILLAAAYVIAVAVRNNCMTGIVGCAVLVMLVVLLESPKRDRFLRFSSPWMLLLFLVGSIVFAFVAEAIMALPFMQYIVEDIFGRDVSITGRTTIYYLYISTIPEHWMTGYGFGSGNVVASAMFDFDNVQNAIFHWVIQIGVFGTVGLVILMLTIFKEITWKNTRNMPKILVLLALIYMYIVLGSVETSFDMAFILWFALIFMLVNEKVPKARRVVSEVPVCVSADEGIAGE